MILGGNCGMESKKQYLVSGSSADIEFKVMGHGICVNVDENSPKSLI